jgi:hypothetical protein
MSLHHVWEGVRGGGTESQKTCLVNTVLKHPGKVEDSIFVDKKG